jgi:hypothetical protein
LDYSRLNRRVSARVHSFSAAYGCGPLFAFKQIDIHEILHSDEVFTLKLRLLLKALWLLTFLFFSIVLSVRLAGRGAIILPLLHSIRNANLGAEELDRSYTLIQTKESGLRDGVLISPTEMLEKESRLGGNSGRLYAEHLAYALTMRILSFGTVVEQMPEFPPAKH